MDLFTDVGPVIDAEAQADIRDYIAAARAEGRVMKEMTAPKDGTFIAPTVISVSGIAAMPREIFGPVLHIATFKAGEVMQVVEAVNATGYGLTFGLHTRIDDRVQAVIEALHVRNTYVKRNQIGAVVGSQPFGGEGLSGTGPKAGDVYKRQTRPRGITAISCGSRSITPNSVQKRRRPSCGTTSNSLSALKK